MLILSRREDQKILFPALGITIEVVGVQGKKVRLGVDAPPSVRIIRDELQGQLSDQDLAAQTPSEQPAETEQQRAQRHQANNRLNAISLKLQIGEKLFKQGETERGLAQIESVLAELASLEQDANKTVKGVEEKAPVDQAAGPSDLKRAVKVLLVEDNPNERQLLSTILEMGGVEVVTAPDGQAALNYLEQNELPDVVLIDMQMPQLNGPQTISIIREQLKLFKLPIYGVSGLQRSDVNIPLSDRGVSGWFAKPVQVGKLLDQIFSDCENRSQLN
jgi:carbon storage regulator CsrA